MVRRLRRLFISTPAQITALIVFLLAVTRFVQLYNHDPQDAPYYPARPLMSVENKNIDWAKYKYVMIAATQEQLCGAVTVWSEIELRGSRANRLMVYPSTWSRDEKDPATGELTVTARLLSDAKDKYKAILYPVESLREEHRTWPDAYLKLLAFNLTDWKRVLVLDSDSMVRGNMDDLFLFPESRLAMPYVWWGGGQGWDYSAQMLLIQPSHSEFSKLENVVRSATEGETDLSILQNVYGDQTLKIPHRPYGLTTVEFRRQNHRAYTGGEKWHAEKALRDTKILHFSDWPIPKPWLRAPKDLINRHMPACQQSPHGFGATDCTDRETWLKMYAEYEDTRMAVCGVGFEVTLMKEDVEALDPAKKKERWFHADV
ncbi:glucose N-acetyltransferase [Phlyctema vagabunda]|uniref:Glucose N-acetyltransferase n=1 Tax=Phlyctema vagabunda TaxID=108571 RepID=A0ABR4P8L1_9HELO